MDGVALTVAVSACVTLPAWLSSGHTPAPASDAVAVLPSWVVEPYRRTHAIATARLTKRGMPRTWFRATRRGESSADLDEFVVLLDERFAARTRKKRR